MIPAALVCEGGAFRGLYAGGVMDSLLKNELEFEMTVGVSAGSLCACNYISRQYRRTLTLNRLYRKDSRYVGKEALRNSGGVIDVGFVFSEEVQQKCPWDTETFYGTDQKFYIVATDCKTGKPAYFEHKEWDVPTAGMGAVQALSEAVGRVGAVGRFVQPYPAADSAAEL